MTQRTMDDELISLRTRIDGLDALYVSIGERDAMPRAEIRESLLSSARALSASHRDIAKHHRVREGIDEKLAMLLGSIARMSTELEMKERRDAMDPDDAIASLSAAIRKVREALEFIESRNPSAALMFADRVSNADLYTRIGAICKDLLGSPSIVTRTRAQKIVNILNSWRKRRAERASL